jgi:arylsulfatase A-like enzyme
MGKQNMYDHSVRVPFMIVGPGIRKGAANRTPIYLQDILPTALEIAGKTVPDEVDFKSLMPLLEGQTGEHYEAVYGCYTEKQRMICKDGWKLIYYPAADVYRLYNVVEDPSELNDRAADPECQARLDALRLEMRKLCQSVNDPLEFNDPADDRDAEQ